MMTSESQKLERVRRRIVGLRALARNNSNENEAQAAATMADKLAEKYNIDLPHESTTREAPGFNVAAARATAEWNAGSMAEMMADLMDTLKSGFRRGTVGAASVASSFRDMADIFGVDAPSAVPPKKRGRVVVTEYPTTDDARKFGWECPKCGSREYLSFSNEAIFNHQRQGGDNLVRETFNTLARRPMAWLCSQCVAKATRATYRTYEYRPTPRRDPNDCLWPDEGDDS